MAVAVTVAVWGGTWGWSGVRWAPGPRVCQSVVLGCRGPVLFSQAPAVVYGQILKLAPFATVNRHSSYLTRSLRHVAVLSAVLVPCRTSLARGMQGHALGVLASLDGSGAGLLEPADWVRGWRLLMPELSADEVRCVMGTLAAGIVIAPCCREHIIRYVIALGPRYGMYIYMIFMCDNNSTL